MCGRTGNYMSASYVVKASHCPESEWARAEEYRPCRNAYPARRLPVIVNKTSDVLEHAKAKSWSNDGYTPPPISAEDVENPPEEPRSPLHTDEIHPNRALVSSAWGIVPSYHKDGDKEDHFRMFNARSDNLKRVHARLLNLGTARRCVAVVQGFYEWKRIRDPTAKGNVRRVPYFVTHKDGRPMMIAGVIDVLHRKDGTKLISHAVVTVDVSETLSWLHIRMPAILQNDTEIDTWLQGDEESAMALLKPTDDVAWRRVTDKINVQRYQGVDCQREFVPTPGLKAFFGGSPTKAKTKQQKGNAAVSTTEESNRTTKRETGSSTSDDKSTNTLVFGEDRKEIKHPNKNAEVSATTQDIKTTKRSLGSDNSNDLQGPSKVICLDDDDDDNTYPVALEKESKSHSSPIRSAPSTPKSKSASNNRRSPQQATVKSGPLDRFFGTPKK